MGGRWNIFDAVLLGLSFADMFLVAATVNFTFIRILRLFRIIRTFRMVRLLRFAGTFKNLRLMVLAIIKSTTPLLIGCLILSVLIFLFAVIVLNGVAAHIEEASLDDSNVDRMLVYFSSMPMAMLTLFMSITGGVSWWEVQSLLLQIHVAYGIVFVSYIAIMLVAVLNIITGVFVNEALDMAASDHDVMLHAEQEMKLDHIKKLRQLFHRFDSDAKYALTVEDFESHIKDPEVQVILGMLGLDISEAPAFFNLLDVDRSGEVEIDEFVMGCLNLKGKTNIMDMELAIQETRRMVRKLLDAQKLLNHRVDLLLNNGSKPLLPSLGNERNPDLFHANPSSKTSQRSLGTNPSVRWREREATFETARLHEQVDQKP